MYSVVLSLGCFEVFSLSATPLPATYEISTRAETYSDYYQIY